MKPKRTITNTVTFMVFLAIIAVVLVFILSISRVTAPSSFRSTEGSTPLMTSSITSSPNETQTAAAIITSKAIDEATYLATTRTPVTPIYLPTGIYDDQRVKISAALIFIEAQNAWGGFIDGYRFSLYAGSKQSDPEQGIIGLVINIPNSQTIDQFVTPSKHGAIRVVTEQNNRFTLAATDGTMFYFDLPTRQFVASSTEVAPSVTPSPVTTPTQTSVVPYPMPTEPSTEAP
jgi:hypothetical protein